MNRRSKLLLSTTIAFALIGFESPAFAQQATFSGNGNSSYGGYAGSGSMTVTNDGLDFATGTGYVDFSYTLAGNTLASWGNNIVIYLDNGQGGGIASTTATYMTTSGNGGAYSVTENTGAGGYATLNFGGLMAPQYAIEIDQFNYGQIFSDTGGVPTYIDGTSSGNTTGGGLSYLISGDTYSVNIPLADFGLNVNSDQAIELASIVANKYGNNVSNEGTEGITGTPNLNANQTLTSVDTIVVPEPSTFMMLLGSSMFGSFYLMRRRRK
jgi:hypothetical protein